MWPKTTNEAAKYVGMNVGQFKHHVYKSRRVKPDMKRGNTLFFNKGTLDDFKKNLPKLGRPPKAGDD